MAGLRTVAGATLFAAVGLVLGGPGASAHDPAAPAAAAPAPTAGAADRAAFAPPEPGTYALPALGRAADGEVLTSDGETTRLHQVFGDRVVVLAFVYTHCDDAQGCPLATAVLHRVQSALADRPEVARRLRFVSLSFDPARDTPETLRRYGQHLTRGAVDWSLLTTASPERLAPILDAYGQGLVREVDETGRETGDLAHVLRVFLIDPTRRIRNVYSTSFLHAETLLADVRTLLLEEEAARPEAAPSPRGRALDLLARARAPRLGLPPVPVPADNLQTPEKVALGRKLFHDRRLSGNGTFSCAMCHVPAQGFSSTELETAAGIEGRTVRRNAPTILDAAYHERLFHDGRETRLEHQVWAPLLARNEMGNVSIGAVLETIRGAPDYAGLFEAAFPERGLAMETVGMAMASYERTLVTGSSAFDRWRYGGDEAALSAEAVRGFALFTGEAGCSACHTVGADHALFSDGGFHNTGIGVAALRARERGPLRVAVAPGVTLDVPVERVEEVSGPVPNDLGRYEVTGDPDDRWKYRTPGLRNVARTPPYMHDGSLATLEDVVRFYDRGGVPNPLLDPRIRPLGLSEADASALVAFLRSLTGGDVDALVADALAAPVGNPGSGGGG